MKLRELKELLAELQKAEDSLNRQAQFLDGPPGNIWNAEARVAAYKEAEKKYIRLSDREL